MTSRGRAGGYTLVELLVALAVAALLLQALSTMLDSGWSASEQTGQRMELVRQARFAMARMVDTVAEAERLLVPLGDDPSTEFVENLRAQTVPASPPPGGSSLASAVLAVTLGVSRDLDFDGVPDADNDGDGRIDEDLPADAHNDASPGLRNLDDDGRGTTDFVSSPDGDDDESASRQQSEDPLNGIDDDADGSVDEDPGADSNGDGAPGVAGVDDDGDGSIDEGSVNDDDEDGLVDEDWYDPVAFYLQGDALIERRPVPWDENGDGSRNGRDVIESTLAAGVTLLRFERVPAASGQAQLVDITLALASGDGSESFELNTRVRVGGTR